MVSQKKRHLKTGFEKATAAPQVLYHGIPVKTEGNEIRPGTNYGTTILPSVRDSLGVSATEHVPLVFASDHPKKALAYGFSLKERELLWITYIDGTDSELVIVCNRDVTMTRPREGTIYSFSSEGFQPLPNAQRQYVSDKPVPLSKAEVVVEVRSAEDLLRHGLQVLSLAGSFDELHDAPHINALLDSRGPDFYESLSRMVADGSVIWENHARNIALHPELAKRLHIKLPKAAPAKPATVKP